MLNLEDGAVDLRLARASTPIRRFSETEVVQNVFCDRRCLQEICDSARCASGTKSNAAIMENHCGFWSSVTFNQSTNTFDFLIGVRFECNVIVDKDDDWDSCDCYETLRQPDNIKSVFDLQDKLNKMSHQ